MSRTRALPWVGALAVSFAGATAVADAPPEDETAPVVTITTPSARTELPAGTTKITVEAKVEEPESGVGEVKLVVDDKDVATLDREPEAGKPWVFADVELTPGEHRLVVTATNYDMDEGESSPVVVVVAAVPEPAAKAEPEAAEAEADPPKAAADEKAPAKADPAKAEAKPPADAKAAAADAKDGCFASARPRSLVGSGIAFAIALVAGLALRRRRP